MMHKAIKGFEDYLVSNNGRVYSLKSQKYLKGALNSNGYYKVNLCKGGKMYPRNIHRLVAEAFISNPDNLPQVDHINRDKTDNRVENLRWVTASENNKNRDHYQINRKGKGQAIVEKINDEVSIGYLSLVSVPNINEKTLRNHTSDNETHFIAKGREFYTEPKA